MKKLMATCSVSAALVATSVIADFQQLQTSGAVKAENVTLLDTTLLRTDFVTLYNDSCY